MMEKRRKEIIERTQGTRGSRWEKKKRGMQQKRTRPKL